MEDSPIVKVRGRPRKTIGKTFFKKNLEANGLFLDLIHDWTTVSIDPCSEGLVVVVVD